MSSHISHKKLSKKISEHKLFLSGIFIKGVFGILESIVGIFLLIAGTRPSSRVAQYIFGHEVISDRTTIIGSFLLRIAHNLSLKMHIFVGSYMIVHGIVNIGMVLALVYKKLWAFPIVGILLALFLVYQIYQLVHVFSIILLLLTIADVIILSLLKIEYDRLKNSKEDLI